MPNRPVIVAADGTWVVRAGGAVIGESSRAVELIEADGAVVVYFPREDLGMAFLEGSDPGIHRHAVRVLIRLHAPAMGRGASQGPVSRPRWHRGRDRREWPVAPRP